MAADYVPPKLGEDGFNCPACGAFANQRWHRTEVREMPWEQVADSSLALELMHHLTVTTQALSSHAATARVSVVDGMVVSKCDRCKEAAIWFDERLLWPKGGLALDPDPNLPDSVRRTYQEANSIARESPRAAAMLVRLAIEELCQTLVPEENLSLDRRIRRLVKQGLSSRTQKALDVVRVIGNQAAHPGRMDPRDDVETVYALLGLVNLIAGEVISVPKAVDAIYGRLPEGIRKRIASEDGRGEPQQHE